MSKNWHSGTEKQSYKDYMDIKLRPHQKRFLDSNPDRALLVWEMRTGKSLPAVLWSNHPSRNSNSIIVCLKANKTEWVNNAPHATVYTKEEFKKHASSLVKPSCIVIDEAHNFAAPLFITKKRSQQVEALYGLIKRNPQMHVLLLTATPLSNDPASIHTLLTYIGHYIDWKQFQQHFYNLEYKPFLPRPAWFPKKDWRQEANRLIFKYGDVVSLVDCVDSIPPVIEEVVYIKTPPREYADDEDYHWTKDHLHEQSLKVSKIKEIGSGYRKVILVCHFTQQIDDLVAALKNDKPVYVLDGRTKDADKTKREAQEASDCYFIVQAKMGFGWDGYMFGCMVFLSMEHRQLDLTQMLGRLTSVDYPKPCVYYWLIGGKWDDRMYKTLKAGENFNPHKYESTT